MSKLINTQLSFDHYDAVSSKTDLLDPLIIKPLAFGLYGEVGSVLSLFKKSLYREPNLHPAVYSLAVEEFGDILWYYAALCRRFGLCVSKIAAMTDATLDLRSAIAPGHMTTSPLTVNRTFVESEVRDQLLVQLAHSASDLLDVTNAKAVDEPTIVNFFSTYLRSIQSMKIPLAVIMAANIEKISSLYLMPSKNSLPTFDDDFIKEEQIPKKFSIEISERANGKCYMRWRGIFLGAPLTDNIEDVDGYRFHDVFHLAYAAILHWSPTFRSIIRHKRKSHPKIDENEDGGRAIVIEEGLTAYIFSCAKQLDLFEKHNKISVDLLKVVRDFVRGYEVEQCPLKLWEKAILDGYTVFRQLRSNGGGIVIGNRVSRTICYKAIS